MIPYEMHLLPVNATHLEQVISSAGVRIQLVPTPIDTVKQPYTAPAPFLTFDAWEYSVDVWKSKWSDDQKRRVMANWFFDHSIKGTQRAIARYVGYVGSELLKVYRPPGKSFASPSWSTEQREAWMRSLPQLKVWDLKQRGQAGRHLFAGANYVGSEIRHPFRGFAEGRFAVKTTAAFRMERRATMTLDGVVTNVDVDGLGNQADRVRIRGVNKLGVFANAPFRGHLVPSTAAKRIVTFKLVPPSPHGFRFPVRPGLEVMSVAPEYVREHGHIGFGSFAGCVPWRRFLPPSTAPIRVYSRIAIYDRDKTPAGKMVLAVASAGHRLGVPPHTAEIQVSIPGRVPPNATWKFPRGHLISADREKWDDTFIATRAAKRLSDRIYLNPKTYRPLRLGTTLRLGGRFLLGRWTRS